MRYGRGVWVSLLSVALSACVRDTGTGTFVGAQFSCGDGAEVDCGDFDLVVACDGEGAATGTVEALDPAVLGDAMICGASIDTDGEVEGAFKTRIEETSEGVSYCEVALVTDCSDGECRTLPFRMEIDMQNRILRYEFKVATSMDVGLMRTDQVAVVQQGATPSEPVLFCLQKRDHAIVLASPLELAELRGSGEIVFPPGFGQVPIPTDDLCVTLAASNGGPGPVANIIVDCVATRNDPANPAQRFSFPVEQFMIRLNPPPDTVTTTIPAEGGQIVLSADDGTAAVIVLDPMIEAIAITAAISSPAGTFADVIPGARHVVSVDTPAKPLPGYTVTMTWPTTGNPPGFAGGAPCIVVHEDLTTPVGIKQTFHGRDEVTTMQWTSSGSAFKTVPNTNRSVVVASANIVALEATVAGTPVVDPVEPGETIDVDIGVYDANDTSCLDISFPADGVPMTGVASYDVSVSPSYTAVDVSGSAEFDNEPDFGCEDSFEATCVTPSDGTHTDDLIQVEFSMEHYVAQIGPNTYVRGTDYAAIVISHVTSVDGGGGGGDPGGPPTAVDGLGSVEGAVLATFEPAQRISRLTAVTSSPAILVGAQVLHTFELPPGVPPPPPPGPPPEMVAAILAFDLEGNEIARLPLGSATGEGLSCQLLSHDDAGGRVDHFFIYGQVNFANTVWNPDISDFGLVAFSPQVKNVTDFSRYNGDQFGGGGVASWFQGQALLFFEYDPALGLFVQAGTIGSSQFSGASGGPTSAFRWQAGGQTVFVTDGQPGELWSHPGGTANAAKIGNLGNGPRQIRFVGEIGVASNFDAGTLTIVRRQGDGTVTILGSVAVGDGPIALDMRLDSAGNVEVLSTGFHDHTYTLTKLSPLGAVIGTPKTRSVPENGLNPVQAIFVNDSGTRVCITCNGSGEMKIFDLPAN